MFREIFEKQVSESLIGRRWKIPTGIFLYLLVNTFPACKMKKFKIQGVSKLAELPVISLETPLLLLLLLLRIINIISVTLLIFAH